MPILRPFAPIGGVKVVSDDDICSSCSRCEYQPGSMSRCSLNWPGLEDQDGYVRDCSQVEPAL